MKGILAGVALAVVGFACGQAAVEFGLPDDYVPPDKSDGGVSSGNTGLPCDVADLMKSKCTTCHADPPVAGAPMALVTRDHLMAAKGDKTYGQLSVEAMKAGTMPMGSSASAAEIAVLENWVTAGMPVGSCGTDPNGPSPLDPKTPARCSSGTHWTKGDDGDEDMHPGRACIECHRNEGDDAPNLKIAGTVYPTLREPDDCNGASRSVAQSTIDILDSKGNVVLTITPRNSGNFMYEGSKTLPSSFRARVNANGKSREMGTMVTTGDCNSCHTQAGAQSAPGRIVLP